MKLFRQSLLTVSSVIFLYHTVDAEPQLRWRNLSDGTIRLQVQGWHQEQAPQLSMEPLSEGGQKVSLPALKEMSVKGNWELTGWKPQQTKGEELVAGLYSFSVDGKKFELSDFKFKEDYQIMRGKLVHQKGEVSWNQTMPGAVRILLQFPSGLTVGTIADWKAFGPGKQSIEYDFIGDDGVDYRYRPNLHATVQVAPLPSEIFVQGSPQVVNATLPQYDYQFSAKVKKVSEQEVLRVELSPETLKQIGTRRFEILIYADGTFVHEESQGVSPYTYILPVGLSKTTKELTVNLLDYEGNWGVTTIPLSQ